MAETVAVLVARLEADVRKFDKGLRKAEKRLTNFEKETSKTDMATKKMTQSVGGLGSMMKVVFAGAAAVAAFKFFKSTVKAASNLAESINATEKVFGDLSEGIQEIGRRSAESFGLSQAAFNQFAVRFSAFAKNIAGDTGDVVDVTETMIQRVADFASVHNLEVEQAAQIVQSALAGETEAFRRFGGDVSAAAVTVKALELNLADTSAELTEQDKILARYELIMEQTENTAGDFADTSEDLANAMRILSAKFEDAKAKIGEALIPALEGLIPLVEDLVDWLSDASIELGLITGSMDEATAAFLRAKRAADKDTGSVKLLFGALNELRKEIQGISAPRFFNWLFSIGTGAKFVTEEFIDMLGEFEITRAELNELQRGGFEPLAEEMGISEKAVQLIVEALERDLARAAHQAKRDLKEQIESPLVDVEVQADKTTDAFKTMADALLAAIDPAFRVVDAQRTLRDAIDETTQVAADYGKGSRKHEDALLDQLEASLRLDAATTILNEDFATAAERLLEAGDAAGFNSSEMEILQGIIDRLNDTPMFTAAQLEQSRIMKERLEDIQNSTERIVAGTPRIFTGVNELGSPYPTPIPLLEHGGPFAANQPIVVGERGREVVEFDRPGMVQPGGQMGGGAQVNVDLHLEVTEPVADPDMLARDTVRIIKRELDRLELESA